MAFKFDIEHPGIKEFAIVGGGTLGVVLLWSWWSKRQAAKAGASAASAGACYDSSGNPVPCAQPQAYGGTTPTGLSLGALLLWLQDHASSSTTTTTTKTTPPPPSKTGGGPAKKMPDVTGQRANFAIGELKSCCGIIATTSPTRNPRLEYVVTGQTPAAGAQVPAGSRAVLRVAQVKAPAKAA